MVGAARSFAGRVGRRLSVVRVQSGGMKRSAARAFQRHEDWMIPETHPDSPFERFVVQCLKCQSYRLRVIAEYDDEAGEFQVFLFCTKCRARERLPVR